MQEGVLFNRFDEVHELGRGGMGVVYRAHDPRLDREVAVKSLRGELSQSDEAQQRFVLEARVTGRLEHPSIPPVYEFGQGEDGSPFFVLKLVEGETLGAVIDRLRAGDRATHEEMTFSRRLQIAMALCDALIFAHERGFLHRDIKPDNVMLGGHGEVWLMDWGLVKESSDEDSSGEFYGTMECAAPEQLEGVTSEATDQYGLGVLLYQLFALEKPHPSDNRSQLLTSILYHDPPAAESHVHPVQGRVPRETSRIISRALKRDPAQRFANIAELRKELEIVLSGDIRPVCPHTTIKKMLHRLGRQLDNHNLWLAPLLTMWLLYPLKDLLPWLWRIIFG
ncbi:MAG: serine/threonine protein kinase [Vulcanimicrobiota bacterium]